jgi:hypothetical protein
MAVTLEGSLVAHDLFGPGFARRSIAQSEKPLARLRAGGKPVPTFPDHALTRLLSQRAEDHHAAANDNHRVKNSGVNVHGQTLDDELGQKRAGESDKPDQ